MFVDVLKGEKLMQVNPTNIDAVRGWTRPTSAIEIRSFVDLVGYYQRFVQGFYTIATQLARLTQKNIAFVWRRIVRKVSKSSWSC